MASAAERKATKEAEVAAEAAAAEKAAADAAAEKEAADKLAAAEAEAVAQAEAEAAAKAAEVATQVEADAKNETVTEAANELAEDTDAAAAADEADAANESAAAEVNPEVEAAKLGANAGVGVQIAAAPLEAPAVKAQTVNPIEQNSNPFDYQGADNVIEAFGDRYDDDSYIEAEDGLPFSLDELFEGPDVSGNYFSTVRLVEHSVIGPYGHAITQLVVGAGTPIGNPAKQAIEHRLKLQIAATKAAQDDSADEA